MFYYTYVLHCSDGSYYVGITNDIDIRLIQHQQGLNPTAYTYSRRPVELVFWEAFSNPIQAIEFEKQIKGWSRKKKEALIKRNWEELKSLSKCNNKSSHKNFDK